MTVEAMAKVWECRGIGPAARLALLAMADEGDGRTYIGGLTHLAWKTGMTANQLAAALTELETSGAILAGKRGYVLKLGGEESR